MGFTKMVKSKRAWSAVGTLAAVVLSELAGIAIEPELIVTLGAVLVGGYAIQDAAAAYGGPPPVGDDEITEGAKG